MAKVSEQVIDFLDDPELRAMWNSKNKQKQFAEYLVTVEGGKVGGILAIGTGGTGKSTLINSMLMEQLCKTEVTASAVTKECKHYPLRIRLDEVDKDVHVDFYDSPGATGSAKDDTRTNDQLMAIRHSVNIILVSIDLSANSGRYLPFMVRPTLEMLQRVFGENTGFTFNLEERCIIVLTKANLIRVEPGQTVQDLAESWEKAFREDADVASKYPRLRETPVRYAGMMEFRKNGKVKGQTKIDESRVWYNHLWTTMCEHADGDLAILLDFIATKVSENAQPPFHKTVPTWKIVRKIVQAFGNKAAKSVSETMMTAALQMSALHGQISAEMMQFIIQLTEMFEWKYKQSAAEKYDVSEKK